MLDLKFTAKTLEKDLSFIRRYFKFKLRGCRAYGYYDARAFGTLIRRTIFYDNGTAYVWGGNASRRDYMYEYIELHNLNDWFYYYIEN